MHNNFFFIRRLKAPFTKLFVNGTISACFSQSRDELILEVSGRETSYLAADLQNSFSCLYAPERFSRARKNSVDIFPEVIGKKVLSVHVPEYERSIIFYLEDEMALLYKLHGNRANILLFSRGKVVALFKNNLKNDWGLELTKLEKNCPDQRQFIEDNGDLPKCFPVLGKQVITKLEDEGYSNLEQSLKWREFQKTIDDLKQQDIWHINLYKGTLELNFYKRGEVIKQKTDPIAALTEFYFERKRHDRFSKEKSVLEQKLYKQIKSTENYISKTTSKLEKLKKDSGYKELADVIMANLHLFDPNSEEATLYDFYTDKQVVVKIKRGVSPAALAENYYRKGKNQHKEIRHAEKLLTKRVEELEKLREDLALAQDATDLKSIRKQAPETTGGKEQEGKEKMFNEFESMGYRILVGRNAKNNDKLTFGHSFKEDMWLHVKDARGSHVLIKYVPGKTFPLPVIERAAELAAYYSKRKSETLVPVIYTPRKFVRKRKGDPPGAVVVDKEKVMLASPILGPVSI